MNAASLSEDDRRELIEYLDGELPPEEASRVETRLLSDETYRSELQALQATDDLLDELPVASVGPDFTRTTVEVATVEARRRPAGRRFSSRTAIGLAAVCAVAFAAAALGFAVQRNRQLAPQREFVRDFPVIQRLHSYQEAGDVEFLRELKRAGAFEEEAADAWD